MQVVGELGQEAERALGLASSAAVNGTADGSAHELFQRLGLEGAPKVQETLRAVSVRDTELQAPCPLHESLEWRLSGSYWQEAGLLPFAQNSVPYIVNNSGRLSENAALLLFENLSEHPPSTERITVLELGAGSGLCAKLFLDAFRSICEERQRDFYERLSFVISDHSARTVAEWRERKMFEAHGEHAITARIDALLPNRAILADGSAWQVTSPRLVLCNYVLDVLPTTVWRKTPSGLDELLIGTHLIDAPEQLTLATGFTLAQLKARVTDDSVAALKSLLPVLPFLELEVRFAPPRPLPQWGADAEALLSSLREGDRLAVNFGAFDCLHQLTAELEEGGFVLINDYGSVTTLSDGLRQTGPQRFGDTVAIGLSFPLLERVFTRLGFEVSSPAGDEERGVHTRLLAKQRLPATRAALAARFSRDVERGLEAPLLAAREAAAAGRPSDALDSFRLALEYTPKDWQLLGEIAEFVGLTVRDFASGVQLARGALELNQWTSAWLWNVLGDCLYYLERYDDAHEAFLQAQRIDPSDVRTNLNLAHTFVNRGATDTALQMIARGLQHDRGVLRGRLLHKQEQVLAAIANREALAHDRLARRSERLAG